MKGKSAFLWSVVLVLLGAMAYPLNAYAQCYLSQGCKPVDDLNYIPNGTGQVYHGDGASNNGGGSWTTYYSDVNQWHCAQLVFLSIATGWTPAKARETQPTISSSNTILASRIALRVIAAAISCCACSCSLETLTNPLPAS